MQKWQSLFLVVVGLSIVMLPVLYFVQLQLPLMFSNYTVQRIGDSNLSYDVPLVGGPGDGSNIFIESANQIDTSDPPLKKIIYWSDNGGNNHHGFGYGRQPFLRAGCRINTCFTTANRSRFPPAELDALIWDARSKDDTFPKERWPHTRYVFYMMEAPRKEALDLNKYKGIFNWTMTYRLDSDFPHPYGEVFRLPQPLPDAHRNYAEGKTKLVAWFVSNCYTRSGRKKVVNNLRKWIPVDQFGKCNHERCEKSTNDNCGDMLSTDYKFYLSFENSLCKDYVTEKFFGKLSLDVVPVVYGGANYSRLAPPHSYIDALSFSSTMALADYLLYLHHNDTEYNKYFRWKRFHFVTNIWDWRRKARRYCDLCERLHSDNTSKTYNIKQWYEDDAHCHGPNDLAT